MNPDLRLRCLRADPTDLGTRLRDARLAAGLTQAEVATGVLSTAHMSRIETGLRRPSPELLEILADRLDLSLEELLDETRSGDRAMPRVRRPEHLRALNAARSTANWLHRPHDPKAYRQMVAAVVAWETDEVEPDEDVGAEDRAEPNDS